MGDPSSTRLDRLRARAAADRRSRIEEALRSGLLDRREVLRMAAAGTLGTLGALALPGRPARGAVPASERKFLFIFVKGGWDPTYALAPMFHSPYVAVDEASEAVHYDGLDVVSAFERPSVDSFFEAYASRACLIHGMEVRAVTHDQCRRLVMTGTSDTAADDWPSAIAGHSPDYLLPSLVVSGPAFTTAYTSSVIRLGRTAQLSRLLDGTAITDESELITALPTRDRAALVDGYVSDRVATHSGVDRVGQAARYAADLEASHERLALVRELEDELELEIELEANAYTDVKQLVAPALACLELGLSRVAMVEHAGYLSKNWDSHAQIGMQSVHFEVLFDDLLHIMDELDTRSGPAGGKLSDEVTLVVFSEMGRAPIINAAQGKDHWTYTSVLMVGPGVRGGHTIGGYDESLLGQATDLATGEVDEDGGVRLTSKHLGATLMAMADLDPGEVSVIEGVLDSG